ncbi:hypothetical protein F5879DRAFT_946297 [Lentinula edodes]|nr:hypothetical protein F5879DRAFT_946297 [Lentinula edodes]
MATIVHRASSAVHDHPPTPLIPQRRRRETSPEIIDVDSLEEVEYVPRPRAGPLQNLPSQRRRVSAFDVTFPPGEIIVLDSDDEDYDPSVFGTSSTQSQASSSQVHSRDISPLSPARTSARPTGSIFPRMEDGSSVPMRRHPPPFPTNAPPVTANPVEMDYERFLQTNIIPRPSSSSTFQASGSRNRRGVATADANGSSHNSQTPPSPRASRAAVRAGGGIITSARAHAAERRAERERNAQLRASGAARPRFRARRPTAAPGDNMHFVGLIRYDVFDPFDPRNYAAFNNIGFERYGPGFVHPIVQRKTDEPDYLAEYTHPQPATPGFCFDFEPPEKAETIDPSSYNKPIPVSSQDNPFVLDDDGEIVQEPEPQEVDVDVGGSSNMKSSAPSPTVVSFVCSKCLEPLLLGEGASATALKMAAAGASAEQVEMERKARKVWGLKCGHLIDGKCLDALGYPAGALDAQPKDVKGKGKGKSFSEEVDLADACDGELEAEKAKGATDEDVHPSLVPPSESNSIRSRLRSAAHSNNASASVSGATIGTSTGGGSTTPSPQFSTFAHRYLPTPIAHLFGHGPGSSSTSPKSKSHRKPRVQQTYSWKCPVNNCGRVHTSVRLEGVWGPEKVKGEGAIPLFI